MNPRVSFLCRFTIVTVKLSPVPPRPKQTSQLEVRKNIISGGPGKAAARVTMGIGI
jgi:hypothetical protein